MKKETFARFGIATKGVVYALMGILTAMAAFNLGGEKAGTDDALKFLDNQVFGKVLLGIVSIGLVAYVFWRMYQAFLDSDNRGKGVKAILIRVGFFISGVLYAALAFSAVRILLGFDSGSEATLQFHVSTLLGKSFGQILVALVGCSILGTGSSNFYIALSGTYRKRIDEYGMEGKEYKLMYVSGMIGYISRGVVFSIISFLTFRAAYTANSKAAGSKVKAFDFLESEFGSIILGIVAFGFIAYGIFMLINARQRNVNL